MKPPKAQKSQRQKFIDKARELGCDEDEEAFRDKLKRIAKQQPSDKETSSPERHKQQRKR